MCPSFVRLAQGATRLVPLLDCANHDPRRAEPSAKEQWLKMGGDAGKTVTLLADANLEVDESPFFLVLVERTMHFPSPFFFFLIISKCKSSL